MSVVSRKYFALSFIPDLSELSGGTPEKCDAADDKKNQPGQVSAARDDEWQEGGCD